MGHGSKFSTPHLRTHASGINRFDYGGLKASVDDRGRLADYLAYLQALDPRTLSRAEQKPYWVNFYNALTVQVVTDAYPVDSIRHIHESLLPFPIGPGAMSMPRSPAWN